MKQMIMIRKNLKMSKGKAIAQACHACLGAYLKADKKALKRWEAEGQKKVAVEIESLEEMLELHEKAKRMKVPLYLVKDAGLTQLPPGSVTALAIGPDEDEKIDRLTGELRLL